ncbi:MAG: hypothetical protein J6C87_03000 [Bacteroides sp.]|nr:hypothetical protein [Bacteroides sp.]
MSDGMKGDEERRKRKTEKGKVRNGKKKGEELKRKRGKQRRKKVGCGKGKDENEKGMESGRGGESVDKFGYEAGLHYLCLNHLN